VAVWGIGGDVVVAAAQVLNKGLASGEDPRGAVTLESAHRPAAGLSAASGPP